MKFFFPDWNADLEPEESLSILRERLRVRGFAATDRRVFSVMWHDELGDAERTARVGQPDPYGEGTEVLAIFEAASAGGVDYYVCTTERGSRDDLPLLVERATDVEFFDGY